uniref:hypothetical protein n=1 Tax=Diaporthe sojae TaxID=165439 RepID=UPI0024109584|nr:hypothetical protein QAZ32_mgp08 [Diaporthe sojae]WET30431.1 hypothetical protein [Diaporthe sojae]
MDNQQETKVKWYFISRILRDYMWYPCLVVTFAKQGEEIVQSNMKILEKYMNLHILPRFNHNLHNLHTNTNTGKGQGPSDINNLITYNRDTKILNNLLAKLLSTIKDKSLVLDQDVYSLLYNKEYFNKEALLNKYPALKSVEKILSDDFCDNRGEINLIFSKEINLIFSLEKIKSIIQRHNSGITMPGKEALLTQKKACLDFIGYNTPTYVNSTITPLVGTNFPGIDLKDKTSSSIYKQWVIAVLMLTIEFNWLKETKFYLESKTDLAKDVLDIKDAKTQYWLNRQLNISSIQDLMDLPEGRYLLDYYSNKYIFYREVSEDFTYVLLNLILGLGIIGQFTSKSLTNNDEFFSKLTQIIEIHYNNYNLEYQYLSQLRWLSINFIMSETDIISIYNYLNK